MPAAVLWRILYAFFEPGYRPIQRQIAEQERIQSAADKFRAAGQLISEGEFDKAERLLQELLLQDPDNGNIMFYLAQVSGQRRDYPSALDYYLKAAAAVKVQEWVRAWSYVRAGRFFAHDKKYAEAREMFEKTLRLEGDLRGAAEEAKQLISQLPEQGNVPPQ